MTLGPTFLGGNLGKNMGKWGRRKGCPEDEVAGWHHQCNEYELGQTLGDGLRNREAWRAAVHGVTKSQTHCVPQQQWENDYGYIEI